MFSKNIAWMDVDGEWLFKIDHNIESDDGIYYTKRLYSNCKNTFQNLFFLFKVVLTHNKWIRERCLHLRSGQIVDFLKSVSDINAFILEKYISCTKIRRPVGESIVVGKWWNKRYPMSYINELMDIAKEVIATSFDNNEDKYCSIFYIIDTRWEHSTTSTFARGFIFFNPKHFYSNLNTENEAGVMKG